MQSNHKLLTLSALLCASMLVGLSGGGLKQGKADLKSIGPIAVGPDGVLLVADPKGAAVFAIDVGDSKQAGSSGVIKVKGIDEKIAALLGTSSKDILINDLTVSPSSHSAYLSVSRGLDPSATPVLIRVDQSGKLTAVDLGDVRFAKVTLPNAPEDALRGQGRRRRNPRLESITDIAYVDGRVIVAGLSNEEFASTLRSIPYPFSDKVASSSVEIYHGAHGAFETRSPVRTFVPFNVGGEPSILAAYTCTPLVSFPIAELKPGAHVKGKTLAELGNRNRPLDMIVYEKGGKEYFLMANNSRGIMKITTEAIESYQGITERVGGGGIEGLPYETIEDWKGIQQLALLDKHHALVVQATDSGVHDLLSLELP